MSDVTTAVATCAPISDSPVRLFTTAEAAKYLGVSTRTVKNLMSEGHTQYVKIGRSTRLDPTDLDAFIARNRRNNDIDGTLSASTTRLSQPLNSGGGALARPLKQVTVQPLRGFDIGMSQDQLHLDVAGTGRPQQRRSGMTQVMGRKLSHLVA